MAHAISRSHLDPLRPRPVPAPYIVGIDPVLVPRGPEVHPVLPLPAPRPLFSVMISNFDATEHLREALESVLAQDLGPDVMEIAVIDNGAMSDQAEDLICEIGRNRVQLQTRPKPVGAAENLNDCIRRARGHWIHVVRAKDMIRGGFYEHARATIVAHPEIDAFAARHIFIDSDGAWLSLSELESHRPRMLAEDFIQRQLTAQRLQFVTTLVRRSVYEELGGFREMFRHCPDWDMWNRIILTHRVYYDPEFLGCHRLECSYGAEEMIRTGENVREERRCLRTYCGLLPRPYAKRLYREGMCMAALRALRHAKNHWRDGDQSTAYLQLRECAKCCVSAGTIALVFRKLPETFGWLSHQPGL
ncbi:MAG TPA: glycosyltransferase [Alphaproteobacteria bacterium]|nr:glycosyltransferase [Alphaproteobacteria bacterium]